MQLSKYQIRNRAGFPDFFYFKGQVQRVELSGLVCLI